MKLLWATKAISDLDVIRDHSLLQWGSRQTADYLRRIQAAVIAAAEAPMQTASADHYRPGYRKITVGVHIVFFRINNDAIEIVRILHSMMDIQPKLD
jgi:toxin ParE1/3/4